MTDFSHTLLSQLGWWFNAIKRQKHFIAKCPTPVENRFQLQRNQLSRRTWRNCGLNFASEENTFSWTRSDSLVSKKQTTYIHVFAFHEPLDEMYVCVCFSLIQQKKTTFRAKLMATLKAKHCRLHAMHTIPKEIEIGQQRSSIVMNFTWYSLTTILLSDDINNTFLQLCKKKCVSKQQNGGIHCEQKKRRNNKETTRVNIKWTFSGV